MQRLICSGETANGKRTELMDRDVGGVCVGGGGEKQT